MRADKYLAEQGYYESRARARSAIAAGLVKIDGNIVKKPSQKITEDVTVVAQAEHPWVSRGGIKLAEALTIFNVDPKGRVCLDVGASTGGFTDVLITGGARKVYAVDVGTDQLHPKMKSHPDVVSMEKTDARGLVTADISPLPDLVVCDASFISLAKVLARPLSLVVSGAELVTLVKPQFEVGRENIGKGGIVKSETTALQSLENVIAWLEQQSWHVQARTMSPIKGGSGNTEYLLHARKL